MAIFTGTSGDDTFTGGADGDDFHMEQGGNDTVSGGAGIDVFYFGATFNAGDHITGGADKDYLLLSGDYAKGVAFTATTLTGVEEIDLGAGFKYKFTGLTDANVGTGLTIDGSDLGHKDKLTIDATGVTAGVLSIFGGAGADLITGGNGVNDIDGGQGNNTITGGDGNDALSAGDGNNSIRGGEGNDTIDAGGGHDTLGGGRGDDTIFFGGDFSSISGGEGNDVITGAIRAGNTVDGGDGVDTLHIYAATAPLNGTNAGGFEALVYDGAVTIVTEDDFVVAGQTMSVQSKLYYASWVLDFDGSAETDGNFNVIGVRGDDTIIGGAGDDRLSGGEGDDLLYGNAGDDILVAGKNGGTAYGGDGDDKLSSAYSRHGWVFPGNALLNGGNGNDTLNSGNSGDTLIGGRGDDTLVSTHGGARMNGGPGQDTFTGYGNDTFVFSAASDSTAAAPDLITRIGASSTIDLTAIDADTTTAGDQAFHLVSSFGGHAGELTLVYDSLRAMTSLMGDVDGDGVADFVVHIAGDATGFTGFAL